MSLRIRIALVSILAAVVAAGSVAFVSYQIVTSRMAQSLDASLETTSWVFKDEPRRAPTADPLRGQDLGDYAVQALREEGGTLSLSGPALPVTVDDIDIAMGRRSDFLRTIDLDGSQWRMLTVPTAYGAVQVAVDTAASQATLATLQRFVWIVAIFVSFFAGGGAWLITSRALSPLSDLTRAVEQVANGRLDVEVRGGSGEVGRLAQSFNRTINALRQSRLEQQRLVQDAGHDLRTPLASILSNVAIVRRRAIGAEDRNAILADVETEARKLGDLVEQIISAASGENADEPVETIDVGAAIHTAARRVGRVRNRTIDVQAPTMSAAVRHRGYERAVVNLLENAIKFSTDEISVTGELEGNMWWTTVLDRGPGIGDVDPMQLFERFWRSDSSRSSDGSGLGLAIVRAVAEQHGGSVRAYNRSDGGAAVGFSIVVHDLD